jgi:hypothetical protein
MNVKRFIEANRSVIDSHLQADEVGFTAYLMENDPALYEETLKAKAEGKTPRDLVFRVYKEYMRWKGGK